MKCKFCGKQNSLSLREINSQWFIECSNCMEKSKPVPYPTAAKRAWAEKKKGTSKFWKIGGIL